MITDHEAESPCVKADSAVPTVDFVPMNSLINKIPTTIAGSDLAALLNSELDLLRKRIVSQVVNRI